MGIDPDVNPGIAASPGTATRPLRVAVVGAGPAGIYTVMRSAGYRGSALDGVPFDAHRFVIPSESGRELREGAPSPGEYVVGWIERGTTGVLGSNRSDIKEMVIPLRETVTPLRQDALALLAARDQDPPGILDQQDVDPQAQAGRHRSRTPCCEAATATSRRPRDSTRRSIRRWSSIPW